jgi:hypothetical protein
MATDSVFKPTHEFHLLKGALSAPAPERLQAPVSPEEACQLVMRELEELTVWRNINAAETRKSKQRFWLFKGTALLGAAAVALLGLLYGNWVLLAAGQVSAMTAGSWRPAGALNSRKRAAYDISELQYVLRNRFSQYQLRNDTIAGATELLEYARSERDRILSYLGRL